jgi:hypothetical protein
MSLRYQTNQQWADALANLKRLSGLDIAPDGTAINPATGQRQAVYARTPNDGLTEDYSDFRFDNPGFGYATLEGLAPGYYADNDATTFDNFMERAIGGGLAALGGVAGAGLAGVGPAAAAAGEGAVGGTGLGGGIGFGSGGGEAVLGSGLVPGAGGVTGLSSGAAGASGISGAAAAGTPLAPGFFAAESLYPVAGGLAGAAGGAAAGASGGVTGASGAGGAASGAAGAAASTAAGRILRGQGTLEDYLSVGGTLGATGLSIYGNNQIADRYENLANQYMGLGAPSRERYEASFDPNFDVTKLPGLQSAMDVSSQALMRGLSTQGNPYGNPGGLMEAQKYIMGNVALPALQNYRNQNASTGGFGAFSTAAPQVAGNAIGTSGNMWADIGRGLGQLANPPTSLEQILRQMRGTGASLA